MIIHFKMRGTFHLNKTYTENLPKSCLGNNTKFLCDVDKVNVVIVWHCAVLCGTVRYCVALCGIVQYCAVLCGIVRYCAVLCGFVLYLRDLTRTAIVIVHRERVEALLTLITLHPLNILFTQTLA